MEFERYGYRVIKSEEIKEIDATLIEARHEKTGLSLFWLKRDDENKTFTIAFKTLPQNNTGVFHILEHSVLNGSEKYPLKEPFLDLLKGSLNTFLNAMTFPDKTVYPVSSRNNTDFLNLVKVYLDAVFRPLIYKRPEIFYQEGWHYDFAEDGTITYKGVVFNEMKGALADIDEVEIDALNKVLFKDTIYAYNSGGDPKEIPDLKYADFLKAHRDFYAPDNAYVILDGDIDIESVLEILDEYLKAAKEKATINGELSCKNTTPAKATVEYEAGSCEKAGCGRYVSGYVISKFDEILKNYAAFILCDVLCGHNEAPLKKAILRSGLAEDVSMYVLDGVYEPWIKLEVKNADLERIAEIETVLNEELLRLSESLDHRQIKATIENYEFNLKEKDYGTMPLGIIYSLSILESVIYGGDAKLKLEIEKYFDELRTLIDRGYFERLLKEFFIDNKKTAAITLKPSKTLGKIKEANQAERLKSEIGKFAAATLEEYRKCAERVKEWQNSEDPKEVKDTLPKLKLEDISADAASTPTEITEKDGVKIMYHDLATSGIVYTSLYFDISGLGCDEYADLAILSLLLGKLKTKKHSTSELVELLSLYTGNFGVHIAPYGRVDDIEGLNPKLCVSFSCLKNNYQKAKDIVKEIIFETIIDDEVKDEIAKILKQATIAQTQAFINRARTIATNRVYAQYSPVGVIYDATSGYYFLKHLKQITDVDDLLSSLKKLRHLFTKRNTYISITCEKAQTLEVYDLIDCLPAIVYKRTKALTIWPKVCEAIIIPSDISACAIGCYGDKELKYSGKTIVASKIISLEYLWSEIRQMGGAYGCGDGILTNNFFSAFSLSDPTPARTIEAFKKMGSFLRDFALKDEDISTNIIGAYGDEDPLLTVRMKAAIADRNYFIGLDDVMIKKTKTEILETKIADLLPIGEVVDKLVRSATYCVVGNEKAIELVAKERTYRL